MTMRGGDRVAPPEKRGAVALAALLPTPSPPPLLSTWASPRVIPLEPMRRKFFELLGALSVYFLIGWAVFEVFMWRCVP
jgi:hypothetical protein